MKNARIISTGPAGNMAAGLVELSSLTIANLVDN